MHKNIRFGVFLYTDFEHGNLHQSSVTTSRVTYFILRAHIGTCVSHSQQSKNSKRFGKNEGEWAGKVEIGKEENPGNNAWLYSDLLRALK